MQEETKTNSVGAGEALGRLIGGAVLLAGSFVVAGIVAHGAVVLFEAGWDLIA